MKKDEEGYLTVEATITLTAFLFFMLFLLNMGQIYQAQNYVTHGMIQTGQMLSFSSYEYGQETTLSKVADLINALPVLFGVGTDENEVKLKWKTKAYAEAAELAFLHCAGENAAQTNAYLKKYGLKDGIGSIDFGKTCVEDGNLYIRVEYEIELPFAFFNFKSVKMHQQIVCKLWEMEG